MFGRSERPTDNISSHCTGAQTYKYQKSRRMPPECGEPGKKSARRQKWRGGWRRGRSDATGSPETETDDGGDGRDRNERETERVVAVHETFFLAPGPNVCLAPNHRPSRSCLGLCASRRLPSLPRQAAFCARFSVSISFARHFSAAFIRTGPRNNITKRFSFGPFTRRDLTKSIHKPLFVPYVLRLKS